MIRTIAANCRTSARQIAGPTAEQLNAAADVIGELIEETTLLDRVRERHGDPMITVVPTGAASWKVQHAPWRHRQAIATGATEAEALVAALEAPRG
jgi:hypothetical protein